MSKHTKIVATVSDLRCDVEFVKALFDNGMNVVRMNSAHLNADGFNKINIVFYSEKNISFILFRQGW